MFFIPVVQAPCDYTGISIFYCILCVLYDRYFHKIISAQWVLCGNTHAFVADIVYLAHATFRIHFLFSFVLECGSGMLDTDADSIAH
mgnify:CR=1 FL=1